MRNPTPLLLSVLLLAGCGGGGSSHSGGGTTAPETKGSATVSITWRARTAKFVPLSSNCVVVALALNGAPVGQRTLVRPTDGSTNSTATFIGLVYGTYAVSLTAYPSPDGGVPQATGATSLKVTEDAPGNANVSMATTVKSLIIVPVAFDKNSTATVTVSVGATDASGASGATVLLAVGGASETIVWSADKIQNSLGAMVDAVTLSSQTGTTVTLTGVHSGTTQVHATLPDLGLVGNGAVTVNAIADGTGTVTVS